MLTLLILFSQLSFAEHPDHAGGPEPHHASCDTGQVIACVASEQKAHDNANNSANADIDQIGDCDSKWETEKTANDLAIAKERQFAEEEAALSSEIDFLGTPTVSVAAEIYSGFPSVEVFFGLAPLERQWNSQYSPAVKGRLSEVLASAKDKHGKAQPDNDGAIAKFSELIQKRAGFVSDRDQQMNLVAQHLYNVNRGCHDRICPGGEP